MSTAGNSINPAEWASWSPSLLANSTKIPRRYVQIPSNQQKLLDRPDAWSTGGFPNVLPKVLEGVRAHHVRKSRLRSPVEKEALSSQPEREALSSQPASPARSISSPNGSHKTSVGAGDSDGEEEASGTPIEWSPSPSAHLRGPTREDEPPSTDSTPSRPPSERRDPQVAASAVARAHFLHDFPPSSSVGSEPALDIEVPKAVTDLPPPVDAKLASVLEPTPPSAQVIPCTLAERTSPARAPPPKRRRLIKQPAAMFASPDHAGQKHASKLTLPNTTAATLSRSSSPVIPSSSPISGGPQHHRRESLPVVSSVEDRNIPASAGQPHCAPPTWQPSSKQESSNSIEKLPPNGPPSQVPFTAFKVAYPDYKGNLGIFISGVMSILQLQKDKSLIEFLYDDFVRVFSTDYLNYIASVDENKDALTAIQFYNGNVSRPLYIKGILTKDSVGDVIHQYPDEVRAIQQRLKKPVAQKPKVSESRARSRQNREAEPPAGENQRMVAKPRTSTEAFSALPQNGLASAASFMSSGTTAQEAGLPKQPTPTAAEPQLEIKHPRATELPVKSVKVPEHSSTRQPRPRISRPTSLAGAAVPRHEDPRTRIDSSLPDIARSPTPRKTKLKFPVSSTLPSTALSQASNADSIPETVLKRPRASAALTAREPGAAFKRPRLPAAKDAEQRALQFRKFLKQRQTQSSAGGGSTPS